MAALTTYDGSSPLLLTDALLAANSGIVVDAGSIVLTASGASAVNLYDGSLTALGIGAGLLLTSGTTPGTSNSSSSFGADNSPISGSSNGDAQITAVVNTVFQTQSYDATTLSFSFTVTDPTATSISFDLVFGSDEFPEWVDLFVDSAVVIVNGVNYALFNHDPLHPLSVITPNLVAGYFQDNSAGFLPIEYDGVSHLLKIVAPIIGGATNTIRIGIADTGDHILDSGIFIANLSAGSIPGSGVVITPPGIGTDNNDNLSGTAKYEFFDLKAGDDSVFAGGGDDIVVAGAGNDMVYGGSGSDELKGDGGNDLLDGGADADTAVYGGASSNYTISVDAASGTATVDASASGEGIDTLTGIETLQFSDGVYFLTATGLTAVAPPPLVLPDSPGVAFLTGLGTVDATLVATLSDPDGVDPAQILWQWQTSADQGLSWSSLDQAGGSTYTDAAGHAGSVTSSPKEILNPVDGNQVVTLMHLAAPVGSLIATPITTLVQRAVELGLTPNQARATVTSVLALPAGLDLSTYDAYGILQTQPADETAARVEAISVQIGILTSLSDDDNGVQLTLAILNAAAAGTTLDLASDADLIAIQGISNPDPANLPGFREIRRRNGAIASDLAAGKDILASVEKQWNGVLSIEDDASAGLGVVVFGQHLNLAPIGWATQTLAAAEQDSPHTLHAADLLAGFSDPNADPLTVSGLSADSGSLTPGTDAAGNPDGSWTFQPAGGFVGPVELSYLVDDGQGGTLAASQLLLVLPSPPAGSNHAPSGGVQIDGVVEQGSTLVALSTLADADGLGTLSFQWSAGGTPIDGADGASLVLGQAQVGKAIQVVASYVDGLGTPEAVSSGVTAPVANVDDAATGTLTLTGTPQEGGSLTAALIDLLDPDGPASISYRWQESIGGSWVDLAAAAGPLLALASDQSDVGRTFRVVATSTDPLGGGSVFTGAAQTIANVNDLPTGGVTIAGLGIGGSVQQGQTLTASDTLADADGIPTDGPGAISYRWLRAAAATADFTPVGTGSSYVPGAADLGQVLRVDVVYTDAWGTQEHLSSAVTAAVTAPEGVTRTGTAAADALSGTAWNDLLYGLGGNDGLFGLGGDDRLDGGAGGDQMSGGDGNDVYVVDTNKDAAIESSADPLVGGVDRVESSVTFTLAANVEDLTLTGSLAIGGSGNALANVLLGNGAANLLVGLSGNDSLVGGAGNDTFVGGAGADQITGGSGVDVVQLELADSRLSAIDRLTDFAIGTDLLDGPRPMTAAALLELGTVQSLAETDLQKVLTTVTFGKNGGATFVWLDPLFGVRTFLALNDATAGFQAAGDAVLELTGYSGSLSQLAVI